MNASLVELQKIAGLAEPRCLVLFQREPQAVAVNESCMQYGRNHRQPQVVKLPESYSTRHIPPI